MIQKCKSQKRNDPPICVISFLGLKFLDHLITQIGGSIWCFVLALCVTVTTRWIIFLDDELVDHVFAWMVREIVDHFARRWGGGRVYGVGDP